MSFPSLDEDDVVAAAARGGALRLKYFLESVVASGALCMWGDDEGMSLMEDGDGDVVVPVWSHPAFAEREMRSSAEPGEGVIPLELGRFLDVTLPSIQEQGLGLAVFPVDDRIAATLTPAQFRSKIAAASPPPGGDG
ncbi:DUF2750 domain-containing protein [Saccharothrix variisporea]|uniref:DUF2750 domain-containing protein n=1 Tax=Saccharothrix variisporea TaxID=543527 RepID=UPI0011C346D2|nr:DUF2750 domain-containing protein [Saccharothrix variisporea]